MVSNRQHNWIRNTATPTASAVYGTLSSVLDTNKILLNLPLPRPISSAKKAHYKSLASEFMLTQTKHFEPLPVKPAFGYS